MNFSKPTKIRSKKIRDSARGENCTLRIPGICNGDPETTVFAHLPGHAKGVGTKNDDLFGVYACSVCHDWMDGRLYDDKYPQRPKTGYDLLRAYCETLKRLHDKGLIHIK